MSDYWDTPSTSPEAQARLTKYGSTLSDHNVQNVIERIEDYPEIVAAAAEALLDERDALRAQVEGVRALADEWVDATLKGDCPDGLCGACTQGNDAQLLRAALDGPQ